MFVLLKRIIESGILNFRRNLNLSIATVLILVITSSLVGGLVLTKVVVDFLVEEAKNKADISIYLKNTSSPDQAFELKEELSSVEGVKEITVKSKEEALEEFKEKHRDDEVLMESLAELGNNPFLASLSVKAARVEELEGVAELLSGEKYEGVIEKVDYHERKSIIQKIFDLTNFIKRAGLVLAVVFVSVSVLISFNTIRLAIRSASEEISIMRLVGASNLFISGPFLVQGFLAGLIAFVFSFGLITALSYIITPQIATCFSGFRIFSFFKENMLMVAGFQFASALFLALLPSFLAVRKHLHV